MRLRQCLRDVIATIGARYCEIHRVAQNHSYPNPLARGIMLTMFGQRERDRTVHEVSKGSNLDLVLRGFIGAVNRFSDALSGALENGLIAIAVALSTPQDNSDAVLEQVEKLRAAKKSLKSSVDANQPKGE